MKEKLMKTLNKLFVLVVALMVSFSALAQEQLKVSTGSPTGTYAKMFKEFQSVCKNQIMQIEVPSKGSIENVDRLIGNEVNAAIVQTDVLFYRARNEDLSSVKTLFSLYPEEVHVVTMTTSPILEGGTLGIGKKPIVVNNVESLSGRTVAAWGGSVVTAQVIRLQSEIGFKVVEVANFKDAKAALEAGQVAAILMVGGQPMDDVKSLDSTFKLISFSEATITKLKSVYVPAKLTYSGMGAGGSGVATIATEALYVTYAYKPDGTTGQALGSLRKCFTENVSELQEKLGTHRKWKSVNPDNQGKWAYYKTDFIAVTSKKK